MHTNFKIAPVLSVCIGTCTCTCTCIGFLAHSRAEDSLRGGCSLVLSLHVHVHVHVHLQLYEQAPLTWLRDLSGNMLPLLLPLGLGLLVPTLPSVHTLMTVSSGPVVTHAGPMLALRPHEHAVLSPLAAHSAPVFPGSSPGDRAFEAAAELHLARTGVPVVRTDAPQASCSQGIAGAEPAAGTTAETVADADAERADVD